MRVEQGFTLPDKEVTQVTTNIMVRDGNTVVIGGLFAGESMFHTARDASKVALVALVAILGADGQERVLDVQWVTPHLASLGGVAPDARLETWHWLAVEPHGTVFVLRRSGRLPDGGAFESEYLGLNIIERGLCKSTGGQRKAGCQHGDERQDSW